MPKRSAQYSTDQTAIDFDAPDPEPADPVADPPAVAEQPQPEYSVKIGWKDITGKTRTWGLYEPSGEKLGEVTTLAGARKIAGLLNRAEENQRGR